MSDDNAQSEPEPKLIAGKDTITAVPFNPATFADLLQWARDQPMPRPSAEEAEQICRESGLTPEDINQLFPPDTRPKSYETN